MCAYLAEKIRRPPRVAADAGIAISADVCRSLLGFGDLLHPDVRAHGAELAHQVLIAALDELHLAQLGNALGRKARNDQGRAGPQVACLHRCAIEMVHSLDHGHPAVYLDLCAHAAQLIHVFESVGAVYPLGDQAGTLGQGQHHGCISVGKPG